MKKTDISQYVGRPHAKLVLVILLTATSMSANAEWTFFGSDGEGNSKTYIEGASIKKAGNKARVWILTDYKIPEKLGADYVFSSIFQHEIDCNEATLRMVKGITYSKNMGQGHVIDSMSFEISEFPATTLAPGSIGESELKIACGKK